MANAIGKAAAQSSAMTQNARAERAVKWPDTSVMMAVIVPTAMPP